MISGMMARRPRYESTSIRVRSELAPPGGGGTAPPGGGGGGVYEPPDGGVGGGISVMNGSSLSNLFGLTVADSNRKVSPTTFLLALRARAGLPPSAALRVLWI